MLQSKFYKADDTNHSVWGNALHHIEYECVYKPETDSFDLEKEVFRWFVGFLFLATTSSGCPKLGYSRNSDTIVTFFIEAL